MLFRSDEDLAQFGLLGTILSYLLMRPQGTATNGMHKIVLIQTHYCHSIIYYNLICIPCFNLQGIHICSLSSLCTRT